jgi:hypothetical protein
MSSGMLHGHLQDGFRTNLGFSRKRTFLREGSSRTPFRQRRLSLVAASGTADALVATVWPRSAVET